MNTKVNQGDVTDARWITVCGLDQIPLDSGQCALLEGKQVALFRVTGVEGVFALDNSDPFSKANVISRGLVGDMGGVLVVASPVYKQHFSLVDGVCLEDESVKLGSFATRIVDDSVQVALT